MGRKDGYDQTGDAYLSGGSGADFVESVQAGVGIDVNNADPANPIVSADLIAGSNVTLAQVGNAIEISATDAQGVTSIVAGNGISVDATLPESPTVSANLLAGTNVTLAPVGNAIEISASGGSSALPNMQTIFLDATNGDDLNDGRAVDRAVATINKAYELASLPGSIATIKCFDKSTYIFTTGLSYDENTPQTWIDVGFDGPNARVVFPSGTAVLGFTYSVLFLGDSDFKCREFFGPSQLRIEGAGKFSCTRFVNNYAIDRGANLEFGCIKLDNDGYDLGPTIEIENFVINEVSTHSTNAIWVGSGSVMPPQKVRIGSLEMGRGLVLFLSSYATIDISIGDIWWTDETSPLASTDSFIMAVPVDGPVNANFNVGRIRKKSLQAWLATMAGNPAIPCRVSGYVGQIDGDPQFRNFWQTAPTGSETGPLTIAGCVQVSELDTIAEHLNRKVIAGAGMAVNTNTDLATGVQTIVLSTQTPGPGLSGGFQTMALSDARTGVVEIPNSVSGAALGTRFYNVAPFTLSTLEFFVWQAGTNTNWQVGLADANGNLLGESLLLSGGWSPGRMSANLLSPVALGIGFYYAILRVRGNGYRVYGADAGGTFGASFLTGRVGHIRDNLADAASMGNLNASGSESGLRAWMGGY